MHHLIQQAADALRRAQRVAVLTGAGVSKESGIPTYRDALTGLWTNYRFEDLATPEGFRANPGRVWDWYAERRAQMRGVNPNPGHYAMAALADLVPSLHITTQNIDDLHERGGSRDVLHLHGQLSQMKCYNDCRGNPTLVDESEMVIGAASPPTCPHCGAWMRPNVVWFGEVLPPGAFDRATQAAVTSDVYIVAGTAGAVFPAAQLPWDAKEANKAIVIDINPEPTDYEAFADFSLRGAFGQVMPALVEAMRAGR